LATTATILKGDELVVEPPLPPLLPELLQPAAASNPTTMAAAAPLRARIIVNPSRFG
jgi:hypothetical protein